MPYSKGVGMAKPMRGLVVALIRGFQDGAQAGVFLMKIYGKTYSILLVSQFPKTRDPRKSGITADCKTG
jgi:hypothetical protein